MHPRSSNCGALTQALHRARQRLVNHRTVSIIDAIFKASDASQKIARIRRIGPKTATAQIPAIGDGSDFKNGGSPSGLARACAASAFQLRSAGNDGHHQAWQSALKEISRVTFSYGSKEHLVEKHVG
jgi:hypothetical protein